MSLRDVLAYVQKHHAAGAAVTPVTPENSTGLQRKPAWIGAVTPITPVTPHLYDTQAKVQLWTVKGSANDHDVGIDAGVGGGVSSSTTTTTAAAAPQQQHHHDHDSSTAPPPAPAPDVEDWRVLASAYHQHHFGCPICIAAGRGVRYGLRCGVGAALWVAYDTASRTTVLPWHKPLR